MSDIDLDLHVDSATKALLACQHADGHFLFELEADATVPAEYVLLRHYLGEPVDAAREAGIAAYLRRIQGVHGGWPLFADGAFDMSATVKAYFALKMIGDSPQAEHMRRAHEEVRLRGGAERDDRQRDGEGERQRNEATTHANLHVVLPHRARAC